MKIDNRIIRFIKDTGFSSNTTYEGDRLLNRDGTINVKRQGLNIQQRFGFFHWLITMAWWEFFLVLLMGYILINLIFATIYVVLGPSGLSGEVPQGDLAVFMKAFYFSSQTLTTLGYGAVSPVKTAHNIVASFESFVGLLSFAVNTGLLYGRFSKPKSQIMFSDFGLIAPYPPTKKALMMRLVNKNTSQLINVNSSLILSWVEPDTQNRKFQNLELEYNHINILASTWTVVHPISDESPLKDWNEEDFERLNIEFLLQVDAYDETYSTQVHTRTSYKHEEIKWNAKFRSILGHNEKGQAILELNHFHDYEHVEIE